MSVLKVIELVGISSEGWGAAARGAVQEASKTIRHIEELEVLRSTATVRGACSRLCATERVISSCS